MRYKKTVVGKIPYPWDVKTINEIKSDEKYAISMGPFGSRIKTDNFVPSGIPVIRGKNLIENKLQENDYVYITEEKAEELKSSIAKPLDIVLTHRGTLGQVAIIPEDSEYSKYLVSQSQMKLSVNKNIYNPYFVYYYLVSKVGQYHLLKYTATTGVPAISRPSTSLREIPIMVPPLKEQNTIVEILRNIEKKIEINIQLNTFFEQLGTVLFRHWFVDFEFPDQNGEPYKSNEGALKEIELGKIPEKWSIQPLDVIAHFLNGLALQKYPPENENDYLPVIKIRELRNGITDKSDKASKKIPEEYIVQNGDVIFSWSGSLLVKIWTQGEGALNQHLFKVTSKYPKWFYYYWIKHHLTEFQRIAVEKATTMGHIKRNHLSEAMVLVPDKEILEKMSQIMSPILEVYIENDLENQSLSELRDILLPRLMSGEIRVPVEDA